MIGVDFKEIIETKQGWRYRFETTDDVMRNIIIDSDSKIGDYTIEEICENFYLVDFEEVNGSYIVNKEGKIVIGEKVTEIAQVECQSDCVYFIRYIGSKKLNIVEYIAVLDSGEINYTEVTEELYVHPNDLIFTDTICPYDPDKSSVLDIALIQSDSVRLISKEEYNGLIDSLSSLSSNYYEWKHTMEKYLEYSEFNPDVEVFDPDKDYSSDFCPFPTSKYEDRAKVSPLTLKWIQKEELDEATRCISCDSAVKTVKTVYTEQYEKSLLFFKTKVDESSYKVCPECSTIESNENIEDVMEELTKKSKGVYEKEVDKLFNNIKPASVWRSLSQDLNLETLDELGLLTPKEHDEIYQSMDESSKSMVKGSKLNRPHT